MLILTACTALGNTRNVKIFKLLNRNGRFYYINEDTPYTGTGFTNYSDGKPKSRFSYKDGKFNGEQLTYYNNGQIMTQTNYLMGEENGLFFSYYENGEVKSITYYSTGRKDGIFKEYYKNGELRFHHNYSNDFKDGEQKDFYYTGQWSKVYYYTEGKRNGQFKEYYENGQIKKEGFYKQDKLFGDYKEFSKNGQLIDDFTYDDAYYNRMKVGIVLSIGGLGDKSFNDSAFKGLERAKEELNINFKYVEPWSPAEDEDFLREYAEAGYDLVIGTGFLMKDAVQNVAKQFPYIKFAIIDEYVDLPNVSSLLFKEEEGSFLVGALAAMMSESGKIGFIGGMQIPLIEKYKKGYENGAKYVNPDIEVTAFYTSGPNPFNDPIRGKENTLLLAKQGSDVVYHMSGGTGVGVIDGAKVAGIYAIGVDSNQDGIAPGTVLTSMIKRVDTAVFETIKDIKEGNFKPGSQSFGIVQNGVGMTDFEFTKDVIGIEKILKLEKIKEDIFVGASE